MIVVVIAMGMMGSAVGARLASRGAVVRTSLSGRAGASAERAARAGISDVGDDMALIQDANIFLSIVPPAAALAVARRFAPAFARAPIKPVYVDCNAVSPQTLALIAAELDGAGAPFVDAAIFGVPPKATGDGPRLSLTGPAAHRVLTLREFGLDAVDLHGEIGAASALKMCYGALTKGLTALGQAVKINAGASAVHELFRAEMIRSQPELTAWLDRQLPGLETKAQRWSAELDENAAFFETGERGAPVFSAIARFYETLVPERRVEPVG